MQQPMQQPWMQPPPCVMSWVLTVVHSLQFPLGHYRCRPLSSTAKSQLDTSTEIVLQEVERNMGNNGLAAQAEVAQAAQYLAEHPALPSWCLQQFPLANSLLVRVSRAISTLRKRLAAMPRDARPKEARALFPVLETTTQRCSRCQGALSSDRVELVDVVRFDGRGDWYGTPQHTLSAPVQKVVSCSKGCRMYVRNWRCRNHACGCVHCPGFTYYNAEQQVDFPSQDNTVDEDGARALSA